jgi:hypothetical protein
MGTDGVLPCLSILRGVKRSESLNAVYHLVVAVVPSPLEGEGGFAKRNTVRGMRALPAVALCATKTLLCHSARNEVEAQNPSMPFTIWSLSLLNSDSLSNRCLTESHKNITKQTTAP